jgi:hypothetical protein
MAAFPLIMLIIMIGSIGGILILNYKLKTDDKYESEVKTIPLETSEEINLGEDEYIELVAMPYSEVPNQEYTNQPANCLQITDNAEKESWQLPADVLAHFSKFDKVEK